MKWTTSIRIIVTVLVVSLSWYIYHLVTDDTVVVEDYVNVTDLRNTFKIEKEFKEAMARLSDKELQSAKVLTRDGAAKAKIALTFDGLPREHTLVRLLDVLEKHDAPAVFFAEGDNAAGAPKSIELIEKKNQTVGNYTFVGLSKLEQQPLEEVVQQLCMAQKVFSVLGNHQVELFKAPRTQFTDDLLRTAAACNMKAAVQTDVYVPINEIVDVKSAEQFLDNVKPGSIVSFVVTRPIEFLRQKEKTGGGSPAMDKAPSIKLGSKAKTKYENIVDVTERLLLACKAKGIEVVPVEDMKLEESSTFLAHYYEPEIEYYGLPDSKNIIAGRSRSANRSKNGAGSTYVINSSYYDGLREDNNGLLAQENKFLHTTEQAVAFSFAGFSNDISTNAVLDRLQKIGASGTFFVGYRDIINNDAIIRRIINEGHELGIAVYGRKSGSFASVCYDIEQARDLLLSKYQVETNLVKQPWGKIEDYTKEAVSAMGCKLISHNVDVVQTRHKEYQSANDVLPEIFGKFIYSVGRGWIINFRMDYYDNPYLCADVMQLLKEKKIDNVAYWSFFDDPGRNPANDSSYEIKGVESMISNKNYVYEMPESVALPQLEPEYNEVAHLSFKEYVQERYIGAKNITIDGNALGLTLEEGRYLDVSGLVHTNRPVVFFTFDDWGTDAAINQLLYVLRKHNAKCAFFILTRNVKNNPNLLRAIALEGHEIASHSDAHKPMSVIREDESLYSPLEYEERVEDYKKSYNELARIVGDVVVDGKPALTRYFRPPTLAISREGFDALREGGYEYIVSGSTSTGDYVAENLYAMIDSVREGLYENGKVKKGAVFVMHMSDTSKFTPRALDILLTENAKKAADDPTRFEVGRLSDYLIKGYNQSKRIQTLELQKRYGQ